MYSIVTVVTILLTLAARPRFIPVARPGINRHVRYTLPFNQRGDCNHVICLALDTFCDLFALFSEGC